MVQPYFSQLILIKQKLTFINLRDVKFHGVQRKTFFVHGSIIDFIVNKKKLIVMWSTVSVVQQDSGLPVMYLH